MNVAHPMKHEDPGLMKGEDEITIYGDDENTSGALKATEEQEQPASTCTKLLENDVLLGRGSGPNEFQGNLRFRSLVKEAAVNFTPKGLNRHAGLQSNKTRTELSIQIVEVVKSRGGKFLKRLKTDPAQKGQPSSEAYVEVPDSVAVEKTRQSFRFQLRPPSDAASKKSKPPSNKKSPALPSPRVCSGDEAENQAKDLTLLKGSDLPNHQVVSTRESLWVLPPRKSPEQGWMTSEPTRSLPSRKNEGSSSQKDQNSKILGEFASIRRNRMEGQDLLLSAVLARALQAGPGTNSLSSNQVRLFSDPMIEAAEEAQRLIVSLLRLRSNTIVGPDLSFLSQLLLLGDQHHDISILDPIKLHLLEEGLRNIRSLSTANSASNFHIGSGFSTFSTGSARVGLPYWNVSGSDSSQTDKSFLT